MSSSSKSLQSNSILQQPDWFLKPSSLSWLPRIHCRGDLELPRRDPSFSHYSLMRDWRQAWWTDTLSWEGGSQIHQLGDLRSMVLSYGSELRSPWSWWIEIQWRLERERSLRITRTRMRCISWSWLEGQLDHSYGLWLGYLRTEGVTHTLKALSELVHANL